MSAPHDNPDGDSLNDLTRKEEYSLKYVTIEHAIDLYKTEGLSKTDITDAFKYPSMPPCGRFMAYSGRGDIISTHG